MKHLTKDINKLGRQIAIRILTTFENFRIDDMVEVMNSYFVEATYTDSKPRPVALKILVKASKIIEGLPYFQMDEAVVEKIQTFQRNNTRRPVVIVLVDTRTTHVSYEYYDTLAAGYEYHGREMPWREPNRLQGPIYWNAVEKLHERGKMSSSEHDRLIVLRTKNSADKNQKSIFDI